MSEKKVGQKRGEKKLSLVSRLPFFSLAVFRAAPQLAEILEEANG